MSGCTRIVFSLLFAGLDLKKYIQGQLSAKLSLPPFPLSALTPVCLSPPSPTEGGLSVHPHSPQPAFPTAVALRPSVCLHCDHCPEGVLCLPLLPPPLPASFSLMRRDRYGRGGRGGTCLSKPAVENEGSDEGGMLCILNAQTPVRGGGGFGVGIYQ